MKVFIGGMGSCDVHNEKSVLKNIVKNSNNEIVCDIENADLIIYLDSCVGTYNNFLYNFKTLGRIILNKKLDAKIVVSGCLSKGVKFELSDVQKLILDKCTVIHPDNIIKWLSDYLNYSKKRIDLPPVTLDSSKLYVSLVNGCLNHCSFCKVGYANFNLKSWPEESVKALYESLQKDDRIKFLSMFSSNLSLYGIDLYKEQRAHKVIKLLTSLESVKYASCGALINYYPKLLEEIIENPKIKSIFTSLETGSLRIYETMNRPISLQKTTDTIRMIRKNRPDITIKTELIAGYPNETIDDIKQTLDLVEDLGIYVDKVWSYIDSPNIASSTLKQHSKRYKEESAKYYLEHLSKHNDQITTSIFEKEAYITEKIDGLRLYEVLLQDGTLIYVEFDQLDKAYTKGDSIPPKVLSYNNYANSSL